MADLKHFKAKIDAGADAAITQYFYNPDAYFHFVDAVRRLGVQVPITPGIMPIANFSQLRRFSEQCGAEIPRWISRKMQAYGDDAESVRAFGTEVVARLCQRLVEGGAPGLHLHPEPGQADHVGAEAAARLKARHATAIGATLRR